MEKPVVPTIHMNGTSVEELMRVRDDFYVALNEAREKLAQAGPNARDFEPEAFTAVLAQHQRRFTILNSLMAEIEVEMAYLDQVRMARENRDDRTQEEHLENALKCVKSG